MSFRLPSLFPVLCLVCFFAVSPALQAQENTDTTVAEKDLVSLIFRKKEQQEVIGSSTKIPSRKYNLSILPAVGYSPAYGFVIGGALSAATVLGDPATTRQSSGLLNLTLTSKDQLIMMARVGVALPENDILIDADTRFLVFNQDTYGLGISTGKEGEKDYAPAQPMSFNYLRLYLNGYKRISGNLYGGAGLAFDVHTRIVDENLRADSVPPQLTDHYNYNTAYGFPLNKYSTNGFLLSLRWDSRDNIANPYKGWYASLTTRFNSKLFGSTAPSSGLNFEGRYYLSLQRRRPMHLLAFWLKGDFVANTKVPYLGLPAIGWDTYNRSGRGYIQGRFRGAQMFYVESEYRFPLTRNGLLGGVAFLNMTTASATGQALFNRWGPGGGLGLRVKMDKASRTNITIDYGIGAGGSKGLFFNLQEAF